MPLSAAEKQRRYREKRKQNPEKEKVNREKDRQRSQSKRVPIGLLSTRSQRKKRKEWREYSRKYRILRKRSLTQSSPSCVTNSSAVQESPEKRNGNKERGRKKTKLHRSQLYRENRQLREKNKLLELKADKFRKRWQRSEVNKLKGINLTPRTKTKNIMRNMKKNKFSKVRRLLDFHHTLVASIREKYTREKDCNMKRYYKRLFCSKLLKRYKQITACREFGFKLSPRNVQAKRKKLIEDKKAFVKKLYERVDISRATAGKRETVTRRKIKKQKRYLVDSMKNLHRKILKEGGLGNSVSYKFFTQCRPFHVLIPKASDRDTCQCKQHSNMAFKTYKLHQLKMVPTADAHELAVTKVCSKLSVKCMYNLCTICKDKLVPIDTESTTSLDDTTFWWEWRTKAEEREVTKRGQTSMLKVKVTVKEKIQGRVKDLENGFQEAMKPFTKHIFNIKHQNLAYEACKLNLQKNEVIIHIDFSENYSCKLSSEIQSFHFGSSRHQVSLHTGVMYVAGNDDHEVHAKSFCTVSPSSDHGPSAIWAHMDPVLDMIKKIQPVIDTIHFFSDGPTTQYRQKKNFWLFSERVFLKGFNVGSWTFFEAGHGKGPADGVGGVVKRKADSIVANGFDIPNASTLFDLLKGTTKVKMFYISQDDINKISISIPESLHSIPGTMQIHQLLTFQPGYLIHRQVACFCSKNDFNVQQICKCYLPCKKFEGFLSKNLNQDLTPKLPRKKNKKRNVPDLSESSTDEDEMILESDFEEYDFDFDRKEEERENNFNVGDFILVEYPEGSKVHYVGKILEISTGNDFLKVDFMRKSTSTLKISSFIWPHNSDIENIKPSCVLRILSFPVPSRRDTFSFGIDFTGLNIK